MGLKEKMYSNVKKPEGFLGKRVLSRMNGGLHAQLADWGIGFLGAGSIIVTRGNRIQGLTTAAGLWASACIGLAIGIGFYEGAVVGAVAVYITERMLRSLSKSIRPSKAENSDNEKNPK